jgi:hypothetical protein
MLAVVLVLPVVFATYAVAFYVNIEGLRADSRMYPQAMILILLVLLVGEVVGSVREWMVEGDTRGPRDLWWSWRRSAYTFLLTIAFVAAIARLGFYEAMTLYVLFLLPVIGVRRPAHVAIFTIAALAVMYGLFSMLLGVRLPSGVFGL